MHRRVPISQLAPHADEGGGIVDGLALCCGFLMHHSVSISQLAPHMDVWGQADDSIALVCDFLVHHDVPSGQLAPLYKPAPDVFGAGM